MNIISIVIFVSSLFLLFGHGYYLGKWMAVGASVAVFVSGKIKGKFGWAAASLFLYLMCSSIWSAIYANRFDGIDAYNKMGLKYYSVDSAWKLCLFVLPILLVKYPKWRIAENGRFFCILFFFVSASYVFWDFFRSGCSSVNACGGALMNPSLNAAMMGVLLPLIPMWPLAVIIAALCSFLGKTSIGAGMVVLFLILKAIEKRQWWLISLTPVILTGAAMTHGYKALFDSSGRFQMWGFFLKYWSLNWKNIPFGTGFGTFGVFSLALQKGFHINDSDWWIWAHNDWLQMVFEGGIVGAGLMVWVYFDCLKGFWKERSIPELQSLILFGVGMGCEYFLHIGPICAFAAWLAYLGLGRANGLARDY